MIGLIEGLIEIDGILLKGVIEDNWGLYIGGVGYPKEFFKSRWIHTF